MKAFRHYRLRYSLSLTSRQEEVVSGKTKDADDDDTCGRTMADAAFDHADAIF
jgi:hypothetical protein